MKAIIPVILAISVLLLSCATTAPEQEPEAVPVVQPEPEPEPEPAVEPAPVVETVNEGDYEVSQELYDKTHGEIEELIDKLNQVISSRDYEGWLIHLSQQYKDKYSSTEKLNEINQYPQLKDNGIVLHNLNDYFDWVVVPSRSRAVLQDIVFVDENRVIAYSSYSGKRARLYELEKINGVWKVSEWQ